MTSGTKLVIAGLVVAATTAYMAYLGAAESWQYYLSANECLQNQQSLTGQRLRVSGKVAAGTLQNDNASQQAIFSLTGTDRDLKVICTGTIPDNLAEGIEVVVEGRLDQEGTFHADKLLTKCASKYASEMPSQPEGGSSAEVERDATPGDRP